MPTFNKSRVDSQQHGRYKRFVSILTRIMFDGVHAFINNEKHSSLEKGMKKLLTKKRLMKAELQP